MILSNLEKLSIDMSSKDEDRATFICTYNKKEFSCIFLKDINPFRLYITTLGINPLVIEFEVNTTTFSINSYIEKEKYNKLVIYLELNYDPNHKFKTSDFLSNINAHIPTTFKSRPSYTKVIRVVSQERKVEDTSKIYFCGWKRNSQGKSVSVKNYEKTKVAFGDEKANISLSKNISSCWTDIENEQQLERLAEIISM